MKLNRALWVLALVLTGIVLKWGVMLSPRDHISISFGTGILTKPDDYLDGSNHVFQKGGFHLGNGTHVWGETYGMKVDRFYVTMGVLHTNPKVTAEEAAD